MFAPTYGRSATTWNEEQGTWARHKTSKFPKELSKFKWHDCDVHNKKLLQKFCSPKKRSLKAWQHTPKKGCLVDNGASFSYDENIPSIPKWNRTAREFDVILEIHMASVLSASEL